MGPATIAIETATASGGADSDSPVARHAQNSAVAADATAPEPAAVPPSVAARRSTRLVPGDDDGAEAVASSVSVAVAVGVVVDGVVKFGRVAKVERTAMAGTREQQR